MKAPEVVWGRSVKRGKKHAWAKDGDRWYRLSCFWRARLIAIEPRDEILCPPQDGER